MTKQILNEMMAQMMEMMMGTTPAPTIYKQRTQKEQEDHDAECIYQDDPGKCDTCWEQALDRADALRA